MVKRKEINLSELKKALEDSLENKDDKEEKPEESEVAKVENNKNNKEDQASKKRVIQPGEKIKL